APPRPGPVPAHEPVALPAPWRARRPRAPGRTIAGCVWSLSPPLEVFGADEDLARLGPLPGPDDAVLLHHVDEARRLWIAETEPALQEGDRPRPLGDDEPYRVPVHVVAVPVAAAP